MFWGPYGGFYGQRSKFIESADTSNSEESQLDWDNFPLTDMEVYVFADIGAWRSLEELEDSLMLKELLLLVSACRRSDFKNLKMLGMAQGAETQLDDDDYGFVGATESAGSGGKEAASGFEILHSPLGLGYEEAITQVEEAANSTNS